MHNPVIQNSEESDIISLFNEKNRTGISVYDSSTQSIYVTSVIESEPQEYQNLIKFLMITPCMKVILPQKPPKDLLDTILYAKDEHSKIEKSSQEQAENSIKMPSDDQHGGYIIYLKKSEFELEPTINQLLTLDYSKIQEESSIEGVDLKTLDKKAKMCFLKTIVDLDNVPMIKSLGGLLNFLFQTNQINKNFRIDKIKMKEPTKNVYINLKTYNSLSIFKEDIHPSQIKGKGRSKEGFSLYTLFESSISTTHGRKLLKNWFLNPTFDNSILEDRLYTIEFFLEKFSLQDFEKLRKSLQKTYDLTMILKKFQAGTSSKEHWKKLKSTLDNFLLLRNQFLSHFESKENSSSKKANPLIIGKIMGFDIENIRNISKIFTICLTFKENSEKITINSGISEELDELRKVYDNIADILTFYAHQEMDRIPENTSLKLSISYLPYFGYLVTIPKDNYTNSDPQEMSEKSSSYSGSPNFGKSKKDMRLSSPVVKDQITRPYLSQIQEIDSQDEVVSNEEEDDIHENVILETSFQQKFADSEIEMIASEKILDDVSFEKKNDVLSQRSLGSTMTSNLRRISQSLGWELVFETKECYYFKSRLTLKLDEGFGDIGGQINDIEHEILLQIETEIIEHAIELSLVGDLIAELDCYFCYASVARKFSLSKPLISTETCFMILNGRHLLSEVAGDNTFKPNNYFVYNYIDDYDRAINASESDMINKNYSNKLVILSGPNFSGKSIYLKQIGMITFLAHIGSFVPATSCKIGLVDKILSMIHLSETINEDLNLGEELQDLSKIFRLATNKSLILIDEFAKNISYESGLASTLSVIKYLTSDYFKMNTQIHLKDISNYSLGEFSEQIQMYDKIPTTIIVTHFNEIFQKSLIKESYLIRFFTMEALLQIGKQNFIFVKDKSISKQSNDPNLHYINMSEGIDMANPEADHRLVFLYKVKPGYSIRSFAIFCAKQVGFSEELLKRINTIHRKEAKKIDPLNSLITKYEGATRDLLYRINDLFCNVRKIDAS